MALAIGVPVLLIAIVTIVSGNLTSKIEISNDKAYTLRVAGCGDAVTIPPGATQYLMINNYEAASCQLSEEGGSYEPVGCLVISKEMAKADALYAASRVEAASKSPTCAGK
ncbi:hypothetical protein ACFZB9_25770 [Kitasatospora sp. NPDC008050]|uniref:hypothetical protein n=1 Tax=Kitasatospora sp. NPDC008050 TaxID=3364021 RepID=UPI0036E3EE16